MALLMRIIPTQLVFGGAILLFGLCATCIAFSGGYAGLMVLRTLLGLGEAVLTLAFLYLSLWYKPDELAFRSGRLWLALLGG
jgi:MFS family permease